MRWVDNNGLRYLQFPALAAVDGLWHGIFTRRANQGEGTATEVNVGLNNGDCSRRVWANRRRILAAAGGATAVYARQVHGADVAVWDGNRPHDADREQDCVYLSGDALITRETGSALVIQTADCQSVLMVDPTMRVVANVHSGWRGSIANVVGRTVQTMAARFQSRPEDLLCAVGPSLGPCCAEFIHYRHEIPPAYWTYRRPGDRFDFWRISEDQLAAAGVPRRRITLSGMCTRCNPRMFYSYRGEGPRAGRFASVIQLQE